MVDAKRRKVKCGHDTRASGGPIQQAGGPQDAPAPTFMAGTSASSDPFAALEAQAKVSFDNGEGETKLASLSAADNFLAQLQEEMSRSK